VAGVEGVREAKRRTSVFSPPVLEKAVMGSLGIEKEWDEHAHKSIHDNDDDAVPPPAASTCDHESFAEQIHYFAPPHSTTLKHVLILIFYHMLPFTLIPTAMFCLEMYWVYKFLGWVGITAVSAFLLFLAVAPPYYSKSIRRKTRPLYETLASYLPSAKYIVPKTPFPQDKAYIFAMHPHGRMFYANALFSQVHEIWREPIKLVQGTYATFPTAHDLLLFPILLIPVNCCLDLLGF
jgi:2-acylglycerol O-acyltransferase 2